MGKRKGWEGGSYKKEGMGVEERMERRKGWEEEGIGRRKGWGGGRDWNKEGTGRRKGWEEVMGEGMGRKRQDGRRADGRCVDGRRADGRRADGRHADGIWEDGIVMASALILGVRIDPWSASRIAAVIVDLRRRIPAC